MSVISFLAVPVSTMRSVLLAALLFSLTAGLSGTAHAKVRVHSSGGGSHGGSAPHSNGHAPESTGGGGIAIRPHVTNRQEGTPATEAATGNAAADDGNPVEEEVRKRMTQAREAARQKSDVELDAVRREREAAAEAKRRQEAEMAAAAAAEAEKRAAAEERARQREVALLEAKRRKAEWEARCQIQPVMTDEEIAVCREVMRSKMR